MVSPMEVNNPEQAMRYKIVGGKPAPLDSPAQPVRWRGATRASCSF